MAAFTLLSVTAVTSITAGFKLVSRQMKPKVVIVSSLCHPCEHFRQNYDRVQAMIARIGCMDEVQCMYVVVVPRHPHHPVFEGLQYAIWEEKGEARCEWCKYLPLWVGKGKNLLLTERTNFNHMFFVINTEWFIFCFMSVQNSSATTKVMLKAGSDLSSVYLTISQLRQSCYQEVFLI